jgi:hypothetical protein
VWDRLLPHLVTVQDWHLLPDPCPFILPYIDTGYITQQIEEDARVWDISAPPLGRSSDFLAVLLYNLLPVVLSS